MTSAMENLMKLVSHPGTFGETCEVTAMANGGLSIAPCGPNLLPDEERRIQLDPDQVMALMARLNTDPVEAREMARQMLYDHLQHQMPGVRHGLLILLTGITLGSICGLVWGWILF